jgi:hypothetical protein
MVKKEVGAIFAALLLVATLGAGVASASGVVLGGGYNDTSLDISRSILIPGIWNGSVWERVPEVEAVEKARAARDMNETAEAVEKARVARAANETAEEPYPFWLPGDKTSWPAGYWEVDPTYQTYWPDGYWDVNWIMP